MRFARTAGGSLKISRVSVQLLETYRQRSREDLEAGGVLLGRIFLDPFEVFVESLSLPSRGDRRRRSSFFRARGPAQQLVNRAWSGSAGEEIYLGEWHTHPEDDPKPSAVDLMNWQRLVRNAQFEQGSLFFVIVGRVAVQAWEFAKNERAPVRLTPVEHGVIDSCPSY